MITKPPLATIALAGLLFAAPMACAQEADMSAEGVRDRLETAIPDGWRIGTFALIEAPAPDPAPDVMPDGAAPGGKQPTNPSVNLETNGKPGTLVTLPDTAVRFEATLVASEAIFQPVFSMDGHAIVRPLFDAGFEVPVTGAANPEIAFDQGGIAELGQPLAGFDLPTIVEGTAEFDEFVETRDAARAEGAMHKLMSSDGDEL